MSREMVEIRLYIDGRCEIVDIEPDTAIQEGYCVSPYGSYRFCDCPKETKEWHFKRYVNGIIKQHEEEIAKHKAHIATLRKLKDKGSKNEQNIAVS